MRKSLFASVIASLLVGQAPVLAQTTAEDVLLEADQLIEENDGQILIAEGSVEARFEGRILRADRVIYNLETETVRAIGNVEIIDPDGSRRLADEIEFDDRLENGFAVGFANEFVDQGVATAVTARREGDRRNILERVVYTACEVCEDGRTPTWSLKARQAVYDEDTQMISYRDVTFNIRDVPVFYLPYLTHPDPNADRRSGLLIPDVGLSSKTGFTYRQPYLFILDESSDLVLSPQIMTEVNPLLTAQYRRRFWSGYFEADVGVTHEQLFDNDGEQFGDDTWRSYIAADGRFAINNNWIWGFGAERSSDPTFDRRYDIDLIGEGPGLYASDANRLLSQLFTVGQGESFYFDAAIASTQGLLENENDRNLPTVLPIIYGRKVFDMGSRGRIDVEGSAFSTTGEETVDVARAGLEAEWRRPVIFGPGLVAEPFLGAQADTFRYEDDTLEDTFETATRAAAYAGLEVRWPLWRGGDGVDVLLEPLVTGVLGTPGPNDADIPNTESAALALTSANVLDVDPLGGDLIDGGSRIAAGLNASVFTSDWSARGFVGQRWRDREDPTLSTSGLDQQTSNTVADVAVSWRRLLALSAAYEYDPNEGDLVSSDYNASIRTNRFRLRLQYYDAFNDGNPISALTFQSSFEFADNWFAIYNETTDLEDSVVERRQIGFAYRDDCTLFQVTYQRRDDGLFDSEPSESIQFRVTLATLGRFGDDAFD